MIGTLLGTHNAPLTSSTALARAKGEPYDPKRFDLFQRLYEILASTSPIDRYMHQSGPVLAFFEAYFSNFIEGTEFQVEEASEIIFKGKIPKNRPEDAHDILGTYQITSSQKEMSKCPKNGDELIEILKYRHAVLMQGRPDISPGKSKTVLNQAGSTLFLAPDLVIGTLKKGFQWLLGLNSPFQRAVYMMFLISEVHPFMDGNGRCARLMMNAELVAKQQARILIPTVFKNNYLLALKALSHQAKPDALIRVLDFAQKYTSLID